MIAFGVLFAVIATVTVLAETNQTLSGCEVCANTGECAKAFRNTPGQFCGNWLDQASTRRPCCCPNGAVCRVTNYACNCAYTGGVRRDPEATRLVWLWWLLGAIVLLMCCGGCFFVFSRSRQRASDDSIPVTAPVTTPPVAAYANAPPQTVYPSAAVSNAGYGCSDGGGAGMSAGTGAALGGAAGLLGGLWLGNTLADHSDGGNGGHDGGNFGGGDFGGGGGGDFGGDF